VRTRQTTDADLKRALTDAGLSVTSIGSVVPSLEDVFLDVVDRLAAKSAA
jgi:hypothetical protein